MLLQILLHVTCVPWSRLVTRRFMCGPERATRLHARSVDRGSRDSQATRTIAACFFEAAGRQCTTRFTSASI